MNFCTRCGTSIDEQKFCPSCGLDQSTHEATAEAAEANDARPDASTSDAGSKLSMSPNRKRMPWIVGGTVLVLTLALVAISVAGSGDASEIEQLEADLARSEQNRDEADQALEETDAAVEELRTDLRTSEDLLTQSQAAEQRAQDEVAAANSTILALQSGQTSTSGVTLATVRSRGRLICGVNGTAIGFSEVQADGSVVGFDVDYCRAIAAAVLGDSEAVQYLQLTAAERWEALKNGEVDVLIRNSTWTQSRDTQLGAQFAATTYYDGQQILAHTTSFPGLNAQSTIADIDGATVCVNAGTTTERNIVDGAMANRITITLESTETSSESQAAFVAGTCDVYTTDGSGLFGFRSREASGGNTDATSWVIFPSTPITREPLGPIVRENDDQWFDIVNWVVFSTFIADENGVTSINVDEMLDTTPELTRLFGGEGELQSAMGLSRDAFYLVVKQVGNYDEIFRRNLTDALGIQRKGSYNQLWSNGGLLFAPVAR